MIYRHCTQQNYSAVLEIYNTHLQKGAKVLVDFTPTENI